MRTISGKPHNIINEGILNSVGSGRKHIVDDFISWLKRVYKETDFVINSDESIDFVCDREALMTGREVPLRIRTATNLTYRECENTGITLPNTAKTVTIEKCDKLEALSLGENCDIKELIILGCQKLKDISCLSKAKIGRIKIVDCPITSVESLKNVELSIFIKNCTDIKRFDLVNNNVPNIKIERCKINDFPTAIKAKQLNLINVTRTRSIDLNIAQATDVLIKECNKTTSINVKGNSVDTMVIMDCDSVKNISIENDCLQSLSLCELPSVEEYSIKGISGNCITENVKTIPQLKCKKMINRR